MNLSLNSSSITWRFPVLDYFVKRIVQDFLFHNKRGMPFNIDIWSSLVKGEVMGQKKGLPQRHAYMDADENETSRGSRRCFYVFSSSNLRHFRAHCILGDDNNIVTLSPR